MGKTNKILAPTLLPFLTTYFSYVDSLVGLPPYHSSAAHHVNYDCVILGYLNIVITLINVVVRLTVYYFLYTNIVVYTNKAKSNSVFVHILFCVCFMFFSS